MMKHNPNVNIFSFTHFPYAADVHYVINNSWPVNRGMDLLSKTASVCYSVRKISPANTAMNSSIQFFSVCSIYFHPYSNIYFSFHCFFRAFNHTEFHSFRNSTRFWKKNLQDCGKETTKKVTTTKYLDHI